MSLTMPWAAFGRDGERNDALKSTQPPVGNNEGASTAPPGLTHACRQAPKRKWVGAAPARNSPSSEGSHLSLRAQPERRAWV